MDLTVLADQANRELWLEARRSGLGGSDMAAICGESKWRTAIDVWCDRMEPQFSESNPSNSLLTGGEASDRLSMGHVLEPMVMQEAAAGRWVDGRARLIWRPPLVARKDCPWHIGSADGLSVAGPSVYLPDCFAMQNLEPPGGGWWDVVEEVKTHGARGFAEYADRKDDEFDPVPADKMIQCGWYAGLWNVPVVSLSAIFDTHIRRHWRWLVDPEYVASLQTIAEDWWRKHIIGGVRPDPDGTERWSKYIKRRFAGVMEEQTGTANADLNAEIVKLGAARDAAKAAEAEVERLEQVIKASMGTVTVLESAMGRIIWRTQEGRVKPRAVIDELARQYQVPSDKLAAIESANRGEPPRPFLFPRKKKS